MGKNIGVLGQQRKPLDLEFTYFDNMVVRVHPYASDGVEIDFLEAARDIDMEELQALDFSKVDALDPETQARLLKTMGRAVESGYKALMSSLRQLIHPDDFERYWKTGMAHGQQLRDRMADVRAITVAVVEATTDFPTGQPAASPAGPAPTPAASAAGSSSPDNHPSDLQVALALERGRPDLQEFYVMEHEARMQEEEETRRQEDRDRRKLAAAGLSVGG